MSRFFSSKFASLTPYVPGEQPQDMQYVKLNTNESPFPPSKKAEKYAAEAAKGLNLYSDPESKKLVKKLGEAYGVSEDMIIVSNGSDEVLNFAFSAFCDENTPAIFPDITYGFYPVFAEYNRVPYKEIPLRDDFTVNIEDYTGEKGTVFLANPNAPTGISLKTAEVERIVLSDRNRIVVVDEAYSDFSGESCLELAKKYDNVLVTFTFSKSRSMAGARVGFAIGNRELINDLKTVKYSINPYNVNSLTEACAIAALEDEQYMKDNCDTVIANREYISSELKKLGFSMTESKANFIFAKNENLDGKELYKKLKEKGVLVRHFDKERIKMYNRITVGTRQQMDILLEKIKEITEEQK